MYLLPVSLFCSCVPDAFNIDDNIYNSNLEKLGYYETKKSDSENVKANLNEKNATLKVVVENLA